MTRLLTKLFGIPEELNGANRCPTYMYRWTLYGRRKRDSLLGKLLGQPWLKLYLHHFVSDDWSLDLHDHPKRFISIGLKGGYREITPENAKPWNGTWLPGLNQEVFSAPWIRSFPAEHVHRVIMLRSEAAPDVPKDCWTLVIVLRSTRDWGFWHGGKFVHWKAYVGSERADKMKACE